VVLLKAALPGDVVLRLRRAAGLPLDALAGFDSPDLSGRRIGYCSDSGMDC